MGYYVSIESICRIPRNLKLYLLKLWLCGYLATRLRGYGATWLRGYSLLAYEFKNEEFSCVSALVLVWI